MMKTYSAKQTRTNNSPRRFYSHYNKWGSRDNISQYSEIKLSGYIINPIEKVD
jgi:hypothetical protein